MAETQSFWEVECKAGEPDFFVCMDCLSEVFHSKVPTACPNCAAISSFEAFTFDSIKDWGTADLIAKAERDSGASQQAVQSEQPESYATAQPSESPTS